MERLTEVIDGSIVFPPELVGVTLALLDIGQGGEPAPIGGLATEAPQGGRIT